MSFINVFTKIIHGVNTVAPLALTGLSIANPAAGAIANLVYNDIIAAEALFVAPKSGQTKQDYVVGKLEDALHLSVAISGRALPVEEIVAEAREIINDTVLTMNAIAKLVALVEPLLPGKA